MVVECWTLDQEVPSSSPGSIGVDPTGATGAVAPLKGILGGQEYDFAPLIFLHLLQTCTK